MCQADKTAALLLAQFPVSSVSYSSSGISERGAAPEWEQELPFAVIPEHFQISSEFQRRCPGNSTTTRLLVCQYPNASFLSELCPISTKFCSPGILLPSSHGWNSFLCLEKHRLLVFTPPSSFSRQGFHLTQSSGLISHPCFHRELGSLLCSCSPRSLKATRCTDTIPPAVSPITSLQNRNIKQSTFRLFFFEGCIWVYLSDFFFEAKW